MNEVPDTCDRCGKQLASEPYVVLTIDNTALCPSCADSVGTCNTIEPREYQ